MIPKYFVVFLASLWSVSFANKFTINRRVKYDTDTERWTTMPDSFTVPPSLCQDDGFSQCTAMGGRRIAQCTCECTETSTFGFYYNQWRCTDNTQVRKHAGEKRLKIAPEQHSRSRLSHDHGQVNLIH